MTRHWQLRRENWQLPASGAIMGILNTTPDSFSDGGQYRDIDCALQQADKLVQEGAHIIDIGGESTRPGASEVSLEEERARTIPLIRALRARDAQLRISIDTRHHALAAEALDAGADIINDISGLQDDKMLQLCASRACGIILMHMQGQPQTMQDAPSYQNVTQEVRQFFEQQLQRAEAAGIDAQRICLDPGIGFGKNLEHNLQLISQLEELRVRDDSIIMMALSRKRMLGQILGDTELGRGSIATAVMSVLSAQRGADIHRVHEVEPLRIALQLHAALQQD